MSTHVIDKGRQWPLYALAELKFNELSNGEAVTFLTLPAGALVTDGGLHVLDGFNGGSASVTLTDTESAPLQWLGSADLGTPGMAGLGAGVVGKYYPAGATLRLTPALGSPTKGHAVLRVGYVVLGRANEVQA